MPREKANPVKVNVFFSDEAIEQLKVEAQKRGTTLSGIIRMIVLEHLDAQAEK